MRAGKGWVLTIVALLVLATAGRADPIVEAADNVLFAIYSKHDLAPFAEKDEPDPWEVADSLCARREYDAAAAFAKSAPRTDIAKLPQYVESRRGKEPRVRIAMAHIELGKMSAKLLASIDAVRPTGETAFGLRLLEIRARCLATGGRHAEAARAHLETAKLAERLGWIRFASAALGRAGEVSFEHSDWGVALGAWERRLVLEKRRSRGGEARVLYDLGRAHRRLGDYANALRHFELAQTTAESCEDFVLGARALKNVGDIHKAGGDLPKSLGHKALRYYERVHKAQTDDAGKAAALNNLANVHLSLGAVKSAREHYEQSLELARKSKLHVLEADVLGNLGNVQSRLGNYKAANRCQLAAAKLHDDYGHHAGVIEALCDLAEIRMRMGSHDKALAVARRAYDRAKKHGAFEGLIRSHQRLAEVQFAAGRFAEAVKQARQGIAAVSHLAGSLTAEEGAMVRQRWAGLVKTGAQAALLLDDPETLSFFLESGRASVLLEFLAGRDRIRSARMPESLRTQEDAARNKERDALQRYQEAVDFGEPAEALWKELEAARDEVLAAVRRIHREAKAQAHLLYPQAASLFSIRKALGDGEALVAYALFGERALALVITTQTARIVDLGESAGIRALAAAVQRAVQRPDDRGMQLPPHKQLPALLTRLKKRIVAPLALAPETKRVLISPDGLLAWVPFCVLTEREVVYVPSGTTHAFLRATKTEPGKDVLAVGDPATTRLERLPASATEAEAIGDVVLLAEKATIPALHEALAARPRWRAVHLACHGEIDARRPVLSSLALTPRYGDDGYLRCLDVFRMAIPADLVVLSACASGKGRVYRAEGVIGFTHAFLFAGAPRVIVSLWKVDDKATSALMRKFYELWKPGKRGAAAALREAQKHVAAQQGWSHPYFWAAWQLWGLGE